MKPVKLQMSAFGPFSGTEIIEFNLLGEKPLFLINGPTGSGKTTILDGICFALYGSTTGKERDAEQMRCDNAAADLITRVSLVFELNGQSYQITREPRQMRPKARGEGLTPHSASAELLKLGGAGQPSVLVPSKVNEATRAVEDLIGLNVEQFRQVMVLPQGEFRNLLMADSRQREKIFSDLFQTQVYQRMEDLLKQRSARIRKAREACVQQQLGMLKTVEMDDEAQLLATLAETQQLVDRAALAKNTARKVQAQANRRYQEAQQTEQHYRALEVIREQLAGLKTQAEEIEVQRETVKRARLAERMAAMFNRKTDALKRLQESQAALPRARQQLETAQMELSRATHIQDEVAAEANTLDALRRQQNKLQGYRPRVAALEASQQALKQSSEEAARQQQACQAGLILCDESEKAYQDIASEIDALSKQIKGMGTLQLTVYQLQADRKILKELESLALRIQHCSAEIQDQQLQIEDAEQRLDRAKQAAIRLEQRWHSGQAAIFAQQLQMGAACPVCGSTDHPRPAGLTEDIPDEIERKRAADAADAARQALTGMQLGLKELVTGYEHLQQSRKKHKAALSADAAPTLQACDAALREAQQLERDLIKAQSRETQLQQQLQICDTKRSSAKQQLEAVKSSLAAAQSKLKVAQASHDQAASELPSVFQSGRGLEAAIEAVTGQIDDLEMRLAQALQNVSNARLDEGAARSALEQQDAEVKKYTAVVAEADARWQEALDNSLFNDEADYLAASLSEPELDRRTAQLKDYDAGLAEAKGAEKAMLQTLANQARPEMAPLAAALAGAEDQFMQAERIYQAHDRRLSALSDAAEKLKQEQQTALKIDAEYAVIGTLSDAASGKTGRRISLQRFVLSVLLDDVLVEASHRLKIMSKGRYALYRRRDRGKGGGASGLDLMVEDAYYGKQRPVATLSGGESFMAALSLALGLSDVVQAYAGGIHLDTLFIDEGFGSLDPESLDLAVGTLIDLQATGRMIGIISHVPELKEQIDVRLDVHADRGGSRTRIVSG